MTVREVMDILKDVDPDRNVYIVDTDGTAQIVAAVGDLQHVNTGMPGVKIPDDIYMMTSRQFAELSGDDDGLEELPEGLQD
jgi:hypothetical protein